MDDLVISNVNSTTRQPSVNYDGVVGSIVQIFN